MKALVLLAAVLSFVSSDARAYGGREDSTGSVSLGVGAPSLLGGQVAFNLFRYLNLGFGFGGFPINRILQSKVKLDPVPVSLSIPGTFNLYPSGTYSLTAPSFFLRVFPWIEGWFLEVGYSALGASGTLSADLRNESTGGSTSDAVNGTITLKLPMLSVMAGRQFMLGTNLYLQAGLGVMLPQTPRSSVSIGGSAAQALNIVDPASEAQFDAAKDQIRSQAEAGLEQVKTQVRVAPAVLLSLGWSF